MKKIKNAVELLLLLTLLNSVSLYRLLDIPKPVKITAIALLSIFYFAMIFVNIHKGADKKLRRLSKAAENVGFSAAALFFQTIVFACITAFGGLSFGRLAANALQAFAMIFLLGLSGILRLAFSSKQVKLYMYVVLWFTWFLPVINFFVLVYFYRKAKREFRFEQARTELNIKRKKSEICKTKYPILLVHGIFFRDWQAFNYWGRIPAELIENGAEIYYANQQSAESVERSAAEIARSIQMIIAETGAEKINIIAHSKGGLDSRYALSRLGMDKYAATLTTINTPHRGVPFADRLLSKASQKTADFIDKKYNRLFSALGDNDPHFLKGVTELTASRCARFNAMTPDSPLVEYRSIGSRMTSFFSSPFPLNLTYLLCRRDSPYGNDGLVTTGSMLFWENSTMIPDTKRRGISHGDMVDLMRENIKGFDVREFYVELVKDLKERGY